MWLLVLSIFCFKTQADARFDVVLTGDKAALAEQKKLVHKAVADGCAAENAFRNVKAGDKTRSGAPADIRFTVKYLTFKAN